MLELVGKGKGFRGVEPETLVGFIGRDNELSVGGVGVDGTHCDEFWKNGKTIL
jgi:hypothetical protein